MCRSIAYRSIPLVTVTLALASASCPRKERPPDDPRPGDVDIVSRSAIRGSINGSPFEGSISATFNTGKGGSSTCEFGQLPPRFTPGTLSTHA